MTMYFRQQVTIVQPEGEVIIPPWVKNHASFLRWARSGGYPERGKVCYLDGALWVDLTMEKARHNLIKTAVTAVLTSLVLADKSGSFFGDRMMLTNLEAGLSTEPDGMFVSTDRWSSGLATLPGGEEATEVKGSPNMTLEVVSNHSVKKDTEDLLGLYWEAHIEEYWVIDSRKDYPSLTIFVRGADGYHAARKQSGWVKSKVFGHSFLLRREESEGGLPSFVLDWK